MRIVHRLPAIVTKKNRNRHSPDPLPRDTPVGTRSDHVRDALFAPRLIPLHLSDLMQRSTAHGLTLEFFRSSFAFSNSRLHGSIHANEPLLGRAENDRIVTTPAVRVRMLHLLRVNQHAPRLQQFNNRSIGIEHPLTFVLGKSVAKDA